MLIAIIFVETDLNYCSFGNMVDGFADGDPQL